MSTREVIGAFLSLYVQVTARFAPEQGKGVKEQGRTGEHPVIAGPG
jgi:hypothetical protein